MLRDATIVAPRSGIASFHKEARPSIRSPYPHVRSSRARRVLMAVGRPREPAGGKSGICRVLPMSRASGVSEGLPRAPVEGHAVAQASVDLDSSSCSVSDCNLFG